MHKEPVKSEFGLDDIQNNSMLTLLRRHDPELAPALRGVTNAFKPWRSVVS